MNDWAPGRIDAVSWWWVVDTATERFVEQTAETVRTRSRIVRLDARYRHCSVESRAGHLFEEMHALSFNLDAIRRGRSVRAVVTEWIGLQNAAADLWLIDGETVVDAVQAKLMADPVACTHQLGSERYRGTQGLVGRDDLPGVDRVFGKARGLNPGSVNYDGLVEAHSRLTDAVTFGDVRSAPLARAEVRRHTDRPVRWVDRQVAAARAREVGASFVAGAVSGAVIDGAAEACAQAHRIRSGETALGAAAIATVTVAVQGAARSGVVAGVGAVVRVAACAEVLPRVVGRGPAPVVIAIVAYDVAKVGAAFARDELDAGGFAGRAGESMLQTGLTCAFAALGQLAVPVLPGVGAAIGGLVGGLAATALIDGLRSWFADDAGEEPTEPRQIEAVASADEMRRDVAEAISVYACLIRDDSEPGAGGFDAWMTDQQSSLLLDPNPR